MSLTTRAPAGGCVLAVALLACSSPASVVKQQTFTGTGGALRKVAMMPPYPRPEFVRGPLPDSVDAGTAAELVGRFLTEALAKQGIAVVPPGDLALAFMSAGQVVPRLDPRAAAEMAAREFGASAVLLSEVWRYRNRGGEALGTSVAASVAFSATLYAAPDGAKLWTARFDETQESLMANPLKALRYPGGGMRWLSAAEFARWGADEMIAALR
ncbi:MAG: hypothetical protein OEM05_09740 [Myxococcales bacterium]|nr:hypothetical protein [Myxococcales bacterium]